MGRCPVRWFVDRLLSPEELEPDPEPLRRGELAHEVLEEALRALVSAGGGLQPENLDEAKRHLHEALDRHAANARISVNPERLRAALRRLEADLVRYLDHAAHARSELVPAALRAALRRRAATTCRPRRSPGASCGSRAGSTASTPAPGGAAIVFDYKGRSAPPSQARWLRRGASSRSRSTCSPCRELLGLEAVGGLYQPLGAEDPRPRGLLRDDADERLDAVRNDRLDDEAFEARLDAVLAAALAAVRGIRSGALEPRPDTCAWNGGCAHPSICRCEL